MNIQLLSKKVIAVSLMLLIGLFSCVGDLDTVPIDPNSSTADAVFDDPDNYNLALSKLYGGFITTGQQGPAGNADIKFLDEGASQYLRGLFVVQELPTDECINGWNDGNLPKMSQCTWAAGNEFIRAFYYRAIYQVSLANEFLRNLPEGASFDFTTQFRAEARFIRAFSYWHALDLFGNGVPFVTENDPIGAFLPQPAGLPGWGSDRTELFDFIESELLAIESDLPDPRTGELGRADKGAVWMLLAKLYLNAETYTGTARLSDAQTYLNNVINSGAYALMPEYAAMFTADNERSTETIWSFNFNALNSQTFGGMTYMIHAAVGGTMDPASFGINAGWGGNRTMREFYNLYDGTDLRGPADLIVEGDDGGDIEAQDRFSQGYFVSKFTNVNSDGSLVDNPDPNGDHVETDFPVFRYSDAALMMAEVELRQGGTVSAGTLDMINAIRTRANVSTFNTGNIGQLDLDFILAERGRELYWECHRRTDLIRFNRFTGGSYVWQFKGNAVNGTSTEAKFRLMPIPFSDLNANPNLAQNPGY